MKEHDHALEILIASCDSLARRFEDFASSPERMAPWPEHLRRASTLVEEALGALQQYELGAPAKLPAPAGSKVSLIANRLLEGESAENPPQGEDEEDHRAEGLRGYSWAIPIPDLLGFLKLQCKTGLLKVTLGQEVALVELERGEVVHAISDNAPPEAKLGEILIENGALTRQQFEATLKKMRKNGSKRLGALLESQGTITRDQLRQALENQVQMLFNRLFESDNAYFTFVEGEPHGADGRVRMDVTKLLLESARTVDEKDRDAVTSSDWDTF